MTTFDPTGPEPEVLRLFDECAPSLLRYAGSFGLGRQACEDVVQDAFLALFRHLQCGRSRRNLRGWLFRVTRNAALKERKRSARRAATLCDPAARSVARHDAAPDPETAYASDEQSRRRRAVFAALPPRDRRCLRLRADGLRYREIARLLGMSLGAVAKSLARSMARFAAFDGR